MKRRLSAAWLVQQGLLAFGISVMFTGAAWAVEITDDAHLGVATCASSVCHGKLAPQPTENVWLNEYRLWSTEDRHARAYKTLLTDASKKMAVNLGLKDAHTAKICLDCHADNVPTDKRGPKFQIADGVGCEACHGGGERWIESHTEPGVTHAANLEAGMYPTEDPGERARMCLNCHMGNQDQFTTHRIMGAGHPRLAFELESFTANQPAHYEVDDDYIERKRSIVGFGLWISGQLSVAERYLDLVQGPVLSNAGIGPEASLYDCHSCHHEMDEQRWGKVRREQGLEPGGMRLQDHHLLMVRAVAGSVSAQEQKQLDRMTTKLLRAGQVSYERTRAAAKEIDVWLSARRSAWLEKEFSNDQVRRIRKSIAQQGANGRLNDYSAAEQAFLAIESLSIHIDDFDEVEGVLDRLYEAVEVEKTFSPAKFRAASRAAAGRL